MIGAKTKIAAAAALIAAIAVPGAASAQSYYSNGYGYSQNYGSGQYGRGYDYDRRSSQDPCYRDGRTGAGAAIGATAGAVLGSQLAARGRRTEGSVLGGVLGAMVGANVGRSSSEACRTQGYYDQGRSYSDYDRRNDNSYSYDRRYDDRNDRGYDYDRTYDRGSSYDSRDGYGDDCRLAESRIRLPDGRYETRYVRSCRDGSGRYRVVD
ncbi:glycine zipper 2TM domain-containing protein [Brevundimonas sp.]|uniref:glycine zipper 2TM domain-containing protein n=1 Tax=Brevundimonas sp. TaxID=1871086 RepID=UPI002FDAA2DE